ncbi:MAG: hypothetical protein HKO03_10880 [Acidimicrobiia bacterium]|nr:hypothetical protein [Acidimicrobiia bacterium]
MDTVIKILVSLIMLLVTSGTPQPPAADGRSVAPPTPPIKSPPASAFTETLVTEPLVIVVGATDDQVDKVDAALALFDEAGLNLPPLEIEFSTDTTACKGHAGLFRGSDVGRSRVIICHRMSLFLLHELAHAWAHLNLTDENRVAYSEHWGLDNWNDHSQEWKERGTEKAANTIAYTLDITVPTDNPNILALVCSYEMLTGRSLPHERLVEC